MKSLHQLTIVQSFIWFALIIKRLRWGGGGISPPHPPGLGVLKKAQAR